MYHESLFIILVPAIYSLKSNCETVKFKSLASGIRIYIKACFNEEKTINKILFTDSERYVWLCVEDRREAWKARAN